MAAALRAAGRRADAAAALGVAMAVGGGTGLPGLPVVPISQLKRPERVVCWEGRLREGGERMRGCV